MRSRTEPWYRSGTWISPPSSRAAHHFRVLRENGVIRQIYRGTAKMNELRRDDLDALFPGLLDSVLAAAAPQKDRLGRPGGV